MKETELGKRVIEWIKEKKPDWEIYEEVCPWGYGKTADIVCVKDDLVWVVELKTTLTLEVIRQAYRWDVDYRTIGVPGVKSDAARDNRRFWYGYMRREMAISTLVVRNNYISSYGLAADYRGREWVKNKVKYYDKNDPVSKYGSVKSRILHLTQSGVLDNFDAEAGSKAGAHWTPYKQTMIEIREFIENHPGCSSSDIVDSLGEMHYAHEKSARSSIRNALCKFEKDWCKTDKSGSAYRFYIREEAK